MIIGMWEGFEVHWERRGRDVRLSSEDDFDDIVLSGSVWNYTKLPNCWTKTDLVREYLMLVVEAGGFGQPPYNVRNKAYGASQRLVEAAINGAQGKRVRTRIWRFLKTKTLETKRKENRNERE